MNTEKALHIVVVYPNEIDVQEMKRIKAAIEKASEEDLRPVCPTGGALTCLVNAEFDALYKSIDSARAIGTQVFIGRLSEPCTTIGLQPVLAKIQKHLR